MNLYLISSSAGGYDTYDRAVVAAVSAAAARKMHPSSGLEDWSGMTWASSPEKVAVEYVGKAKSGTKPGVVCSSFNAA